MNILDPAWKDLQGQLQDLIFAGFLQSGPLPWEDTDEANRVCAYVADSIMLAIGPQYPSNAVASAITFQRCPPHAWGFAPTVGYYQCAKCADRRDFNHPLYGKAEREYAATGKTPLNDDVVEALRTAFDLVSRTVAHMGSDLTFVVDRMPPEDQQQFWSLRDDLREWLPRCGAVLDGQRNNKTGQ